MFEQHSSGSHRQHYSSCIKTKRGDEVGPPVCPPVENPDLMCQETGNPQSLTHPRPAECDSRQTIQTRNFNQTSSKQYAPSGTNLKWTCLPPDSTTNYHGLCQWFQIPRPGQWMRSVSPGKMWTHMPSHQQPSWAKWWRSCRTPHATGSY